MRKIIVCALLVSLASAYSNALTYYWRRKDYTNIFALSNTCTPVKCSTSYASCSAVSGGGEWQLNNDLCAANQYCVMDSTLSGTCSSSSGQTSASTLADYTYPGESCVADSDCDFGPQTCQNGRCAGFHLYGSCARTADCNYGYFCNRGYCVPTFELGASCTSHDDCGREALCHYTSTDATYGVCKALFSLDDDEIAIPKDSYGNYLYQEGIEKLCRNGWISDSGRCSSGLKSRNKGKECTTDADCPTNDSEVNARCICTNSDTGIKRCDIQGGDTEWQSAISKFNTYFDRTRNCHPGEGWGPCGQFQLWKEWKAAELQALYYVELQENPTCFTAMRKDISQLYMLEEVSGAVRACLNWLLVGVLLWTLRE